MSSNITEAVEINDLIRMIHDEIHIDEFKSKLGDDRDICVVSFKVKEKSPARDLMEFLEKGYSFVIDADVSSGEMDDGDFIVFAEIARTKEFPEQFVKMVREINNLTGTDMDFWRWQYHGEFDYHKVDTESVEEFVPLTPEEYDEVMDKESNDVVDTKVDDKHVEESLDKMRLQAGVKISRKAPDNDYTNKLRELAGLR